MPGISDPGYRIITAAREAGHRIEVIPGPTALITALVGSGLPSSSFTFLGFPSRKGGKRRRLLEQEQASAHTLILYESPHRLAALLQDALEVLGDRRAAVALELTKLFERIVHGRLSELAARFAEDKPRGEVTVLIAGAEDGGEWEPEKGSEPFLTDKTC
jgi:16S rRNA (cytidine1402-2'-O)-methyltransferase